MEKSSPISSAEQDQWCDICAAVRAQIAKQIEMIPAMTAEELTAFVTAIDTAIWNETKARSYDAAVEERIRTLERQSMFGG